MIRFLAAFLCASTLFATDTIFKLEGKEADAWVAIQTIAFHSKMELGTIAGEIANEKDFETHITEAYRAVINSPTFQGCHPVLQLLATFEYMATFEAMCFYKALVGDYTKQEGLIEKLGYKWGHQAGTQTEQAIYKLGSEMLCTFHSDANLTESTENDTYTLAAGTNLLGVKNSNPLWRELFYELAEKHEPKDNADEGFSRKNTNDTIVVRGSSDEESDDEQQEEAQGSEGQPTKQTARSLAAQHDSEPYELNRKGTDEAAAQGSNPSGSYNGEGADQPEGQGSTSTSGTDQDELGPNKPNATSKGWFSKSFYDHINSRTITMAFVSAATIYACINYASLEQWFINFLANYNSHIGSAP